MTLDQFRKDNALRSWAAALFQTGQWKLLMEAVESQHIRHHQMPILKASEVDCIKHLGMIYGFDMFRNELDAAAALPEPTGELPPATFSDPTPEPKEQKDD